MNSTLPAGSYKKPFEASTATEHLKQLVTATRRLHKRKQRKVISPIKKPTAIWKGLLSSKKPAQKN